ncbi:MAG: ATPase, T2SS/T4P/T4SS family [Culicoidibacterales bacterium]
MKGKFLEILEHALTNEASDIHITSVGSLLYEVRFRTKYKQLETMMTLEKSEALRLINYIKFVSDMNLSAYMIETGRYTVHIHNRDIDLRISSAPSMYSESIVIRIISHQVTLQLENLANTESHTKQLQSLTNYAHGCILIGGATGSGKSTTLYALLNELQLQRKNVITIEDPIEHHVLGITQIQINELVGYSYDSIFRQILRHDPDVVVFGEIRDEIAAKIAIRCALTGHLVLATIHAHSTDVVYERMREFGISTRALENSVCAITHQTLKYNQGKKFADYTFDVKTDLQEMILPMMKGDGLRARLREEGLLYDSIQKEEANEEGTN